MRGLTQPDIVAVLLTPNVLRLQGSTLSGLATNVR